MTPDPPGLKKKAHTGQPHDKADAADDVAKAEPLLVFSDLVTKHFDLPDKPLQLVVDRGDFLPFSRRTARRRGRHARRRFRRCGAGGRNVTG